MVHSVVILVQSALSLLTFLDIQRNRTITATYMYGPNISSYYTVMAALQRCKCIESRQLGIELGGCNNEVAVIMRWLLN